MLRPQLHSLVRRSTRQCLQQRRNFYFSVPFVLVPGLVAFVGVTVYQVYRKQQRDELEALTNANKIQWRAKEIVYYGRKYSKREESDEVYDYNSYTRALQFPDTQPVLVGHWAVDEEGKHYLKLIGEGDSEESKECRESKESK